MSMITAKKLFERSFQQNFSLAAFNVFNVESLQAVVEACEHENHLQLSRFHLEQENICKMKYFSWTM